MVPRRGAKQRVSVAGLSIGDRIRQAREAAGVKQVDLATAAGVRPHTMWRYERNQIVNPRSDVLTAIAAHLHVDLTWLLTGHDSHVEEGRVDHAAWLELEARGWLKSYRERGLTDREIEGVRRKAWRGPPTVDEFVAALDAELRHVERVEAPEMEEGRRRAREHGTPSGRHLVPPVPEDD